MHPIEIIDLRNAAESLREASVAMSTMIRLMIPAANDNNQRAQLIVLAFAARKAGDMAAQIDDGLSNR